MTAETDIAAIDNGGANTAAEVRTALTSVLEALPFSRRLLAQRVGSSAHTDDQEFDAAPGGTTVAPTGTTTWTRDSDLNVFSVDFVSVAQNDLSANLWSLTPTTTPVTIETAFTMFGTNTAATSYPMFVGIVLADGTTTTSGVMFAGVGSGTTQVAFHRQGTFTAFSGTSSTTALHGIRGKLFVRLVWSATNTFKMEVSPSGADGSWSRLTLPASQTDTLTPTHFGVAVSNWGVTGGGLATFEYVRVYESDLTT